MNNPHRGNVTVGESICVLEEAVFSHQQEHTVLLLLLLLTNHHIQATWHRLGGHGNRTAGPNPLYPGNGDRGIVRAFVCASKKGDQILAAIHGHQHTHSFSKIVIIFVYL